MHQLPCWSSEEKKERTPWEKSDEVGCFRTSRSAVPPLPFWALAFDEIRVEISLLIWRHAVWVWTLTEMKQRCMWFTFLHMKPKEAGVLWGWVSLWGEKNPKNYSRKVHGEIGKWTGIKLNDWKVRKVEKTKATGVFFLLYNNYVSISSFLLHSSMSSSVRALAAGITFGMKKQPSMRKPRNILCRL